MPFKEALNIMITDDEIIRDNPVLQKLLAEGALIGEARGRDKALAESKARAEAHGEILGQQQAILSVLRVCFPALAATPQAQRAVAAIQDTDKLDLLLKALLLTSDEQIARGLLKLPLQP
jgi:hypothetical protein